MSKKDPQGAVLPAEASPTAPGPLVLPLGSAGNPSLLAPSHEVAPRALTGTGAVRFSGC